MHPAIPVTATPSSSSAARTSSAATCAHRSSMHSPRAPGASSRSQSRLQAGQGAAKGGGRSQALRAPTLPPSQTAGPPALPPARPPGVLRQARHPQCAAQRVIMKVQAAQAGRQRLEPVVCPAAEGQQGELAQALQRGAVKDGGRLGAAHRREKVQVLQGGRASRDGDGQFKGVPAGGLRQYGSAPQPPNSTHPPAAVTAAPAPRRAVADPRPLAQPPTAGHQGGRACPLAGRRRPAAPPRPHPRPAATRAAAVGTRAARMRVGRRSGGAHLTGTTAGMPRLTGSAPSSMHSARSGSAKSQGTQASGSVDTARASGGGWATKTCGGGGGGGGVRGGACTSSNHAVCLSGCMAASCHALATRTSSQCLQVSRTAVQRSMKRLNGSAAPLSGENTWLSTTMSASVGMWLKSGCGSSSPSIEVPKGAEGCGDRCKLSGLDVRRTAAPLPLPPPVQRASAWRHARRGLAGQSRIAALHVCSKLLGLGHAAPQPPAAQQRHRQPQLRRPLGSNAEPQRRRPAAHAAGVAGRALQGSYPSRQPGADPTTQALRAGNGSTCTPVRPPAGRPPSWSRTERECRCAAVGVAPDWIGLASMMGLRGTFALRAPSRIKAL